MRKTRQISFKECYAVLELTKDATLDDVKRAYRRRAFELHPDLNPGNPDAVRNFQLLNEAYVALSQVLQTEEAAREAAGTAQKKRKEQSKGADKADTHQSKERTSTDKQDAGGKDSRGEEAKRGASADSYNANSTGGKKAAQSGDATASGADATSQAQQAEQGAQAGQSTQAGQANQSAQSRAASAAYGQEDVLRDLLNDPFARRVFEDIYSEVNKQAQNQADAPPPPKAETPPPPEPKPVPKKVQMEWGSHRLNLDFSKGVKGMVKTWLRRQIDEEQTFVLPASSLRPGVRLRLQIRRGLSEDLCTIEVTLPKDFVVGKPVRLRGLGKKVGAWQGDLYLTFQAK